MAARLVWVAECEVCQKTKEFVGTLSVDELGDAIRAAGWELPIYGGAFCDQCYRAVKALARGRPDGQKGQGPSE